MDCEMPVAVTLLMMLGRGAMSLGWEDKEIGRAHV